METQKPLVFLAFANSMDSYLASLKDESRAIYTALQSLEENGQISIHREESIAFDELYDDLLAFKDRIVIFHYAGHADGRILEFEKGDAKAAAIACLLGQQASLKLVFLNGCATFDHVKHLHEAGVPAIIATAVKIGDQKANNFAVAFYKALAKDFTIEAAFDTAKALIENEVTQTTNTGQINVVEVNTPLKLSTNRQPNFFFEEEVHELNFEFEWSLYIQPQHASDLAQWHLSDAHEHFVVLLENSKGPIRNIKDEVIELAHVERKRTISALVCGECGGKSAEIDSLVIDDASVKTVLCPLCFSDNLQEQDLSTIIPDEKLEAAFDAQQALSILNAYQPNDGDYKVSKVYVPYWVIDADTQNVLSGERGSLKNPDASDLSVSWAKIEDTVGVKIEDFMIPAFKGLACDVVDPANWRWHLQTKDDDNEVIEHGLITTMTSLPNDETYVPIEVDIRQAFSLFSHHLDDLLQGEASAIVDGLQQRNLNYETRYRELNIRSILLPYYVARPVAKSHLKGVSESVSENNEIHDAKDGTPIFCINGQNGSIRVHQNDTKQQGNVRITKVPPIENTRTQTMKMSISSQSGSQPTSNQQPSYWISIFSGIGIGIMVGLLLGLAAPQGEGVKSVVAYFISAVGIGLAALLGLNDRHFSNAKGLRIGSFGLAVSLAALSGVYIRDHQLLSKDIATKVNELELALPELSDEQILVAITGGKTTTNADGTVVATNRAIGSAEGGLFSSEATPPSTCEKFDDPAFIDYSSQRLINKFRDLDPDNKYRFASLTNDVEQQLKSDETDQISSLFLARDATCGMLYQSGQQSVAIIPKSPVCEAVRPLLYLPTEAETDTTASLSMKLRQAFVKDASGEALINELEQKVSENNHANALPILARFLCPKLQQS